MSSIYSNNNANVSYNYQKVPGLVTSNRLQSQAGLAIAMRNRTNINRNVMFDFPANLTTPNFGAGSPTILGKTQDPVLPEGVTYAGKQITL